MHILFLFMDGLGLGEDDPSANPFAARGFRAMERLARDQRWLLNMQPVREERLVFVPLDANLGIEGLPQSGTGQATLFTGINCAEIAGRHYGPYPHSKTKPVIAEMNLFRQLDDRYPSEEQPGAFANAYPDKFFEYVKKTDRWTVTTRCCLASRTRIRGSEDLKQGIAIPADIVGRRWPEPIEEGVMPGSEFAAAERLTRIAAEHKLTLFEYYLTDKAGHRQSMEAAKEVLGSLDRFVGALLQHLDRADLLLLLTSDHGNLEDLNTKSHTRNAVPLAVLGAGASAFRDARSLTDVTPALMTIATQASGSF